MPNYALRKAAALVVPDRLFANLVYRKHHGRWPRTPPVNFTERLAARMGAAEMEEYQVYCDKLAVREVVAERIGAKYLVPIYETSEQLTRELWDRLPDTFVMKPNHGSGWHRIVRDKAGEDFDTLAALGAGWLAENFYYVRRERQYRNIEPRLMFQKALFWHGGNRLVDYKFHCFHGKIAFIHLAVREPYKQRLLYDSDWNRLAVRYTDPNDADLPEPPDLVEMRSIVGRLAAGFDYVRVDLFSVPEGVYFSELTFTPNVGTHGFDPAAFDGFLGKLWSGEVPVSTEAMAQWRA